MKLNLIRNLIMDFDFAAFLERASKHCNTKLELIEMAEREIWKKGYFYLKPPELFDQQLYVKRLEGIIFAAKTGKFIGKDTINFEVAKLLANLS